MEEDKEKRAWEMPDYEIPAVGVPRPVIAAVPGSKSITNRLLLLAALAEGKSVIRGVLFSDDSRHFLQALKDLGFLVEIHEEEKLVEVTGCGGRIPRAHAAINVGSAGTAARFLTALLALSRGSWKINASEQMKKRPMEDLITSLTALGAEFDFGGKSGHFPFTVTGREGRNMEQDVRVRVDVDKSSQFLSALMMSSVLFSGRVEIGITGSHGMAYVEMTAEIMRRFGVELEKVPGGYVKAPGAKYRAGEYRVEPDMSAACYFYGAGMLLGVPSKVLGVRKDSIQGDLAFLSVMEDMGGRIREEEDGICLLPAGQDKESGYSIIQETSAVRLHVPKDHTEGWDFSSFSDQALTLAAMAPFSDGPVTIKGIGHIRNQECDRIEAIRKNLKAMGISCSVYEDAVTIYPGELPGLHGARITTFDDHRVAMAFSLPGLLLPGQIIDDPTCCRKTFEHFFEVLENCCIRPCADSREKDPEPA